MEMSAEIKNLAAALAKAQSEMGHAGKDAKNPDFQSNYATLASVIDASRPVLTSHGLSVMQHAGNGEDGSIVLETLMLHTSGEWIKSSVACKPGKADAQGLGSTLTYLRRYSLAAVCNLAQADDDGEAASGRGEKAADPNPPMAPAKKTVKAHLSNWAIKAESPDDFVGKFIEKMGKAPDAAKANKLADDNADNLKAVPDDLYQRCMAAYETRLAALEAIPPEAGA